MTENEKAPRPERAGDVVPVTLEEVAAILSGVGSGTDTSGGVGA